jgi:hypothetical protein
MLNIVNFEDEKKIHILHIIFNFILINNLIQKKTIFGWILDDIKVFYFPLLIGPEKKECLLGSSIE